jgi:hypothetical protein
VQAAHCQRPPVDLPCINIHAGCWILLLLLLLLLPGPVSARGSGSRRQAKVGGGGQVSSGDRRFQGCRRRRHAAVGGRQSRPPRLPLGAAIALLPSNMLQAGGRVGLLLLMMLLLSGGAVGGNPLLPLLLLLLVGRAVWVLPCLAAPLQLLQLAALVHQKDALLQLATRPVLQGCSREGRVDRWQ